MVSLHLAGSDFRLVPHARLQDLSARSESIVADLLLLQREGRILGAVVLSTCNRTEVLLDLPDGASDGSDVAARALGCAAGFPLRQLGDGDAVCHLLAVTAGLRSMVFGEEQILGQVSRAFKAAEEFGLLSRNLHMLRTRLLGAARELRRRIGLGKRPRSVSALAADQLLRAGKRLAVVGAGETGRLVLERLRRRGVTEPWVINRTLSKAQALARHFGGQAMALRQFRLERPPVDGILFAVKSPDTLLHAGEADGLKVIVDISQPSVVAHELRAAAGLEVCGLDEIADVAQAESEQYAEICATGDAEAEAQGRQMWNELAPGRANLGRVVDLHVEGALAELEHALHGDLRHLTEADRERIRAFVLRAAKRNAYYHIRDIKQLASR